MRRADAIQKTTSFVNRNILSLALPSGPRGNAALPGEKDHPQRCAPGHPEDRAHSRFWCRVNCRNNGRRVVTAVRHRVCQQVQRCSKQLGRGRKPLSAVQGLELRGTCDLMLNPGRVQGFQAFCSCVGVHCASDLLSPTIAVPLGRPLSKIRAS